MASVHKRPNSKFWHAAWRTTGGVLKLQSTKCTDRKKAIAAAFEFERAEKLAGAGTLVEAQARKILADIVERTGGGETLRTVSIRDYFNEWLKSKQAEKAANTGDRYRIAVEKFISSLESRADKPLTALTTRDVQHYMDKRRAEKLAPRTILLCVKIIRTALNRARKQGLIPNNPAEGVDLPTAKGIERGTFTPTEVKLLVETAQGEWKTLILLAYFTGARLSDCCRMPWTGVNLSSGTLKYTQSKTGQEVTVPLHLELLAHLEKLAGSDKPEEFITPHMAELKPGGRHGLSEGFKRIMVKAGLDLGTVQGAGVRKMSTRTFHALRHSFTSALANAGVAAEVRMKLTGHKTEAVHRGYTHHELEPLREAIQKIPKLV